MMRGWWGSQAGVAKPALQCLTYMLEDMHSDAWPAAAPAFGLLLSFVVDPRPKVGVSLSGNAAIARDFLLPP